jgi:hypothetical protein
MSDGNDELDLHRKGNACGVGICPSLLLLLLLPAGMQCMFNRPAGLASFNRTAAQRRALVIRAFLGINRHPKNFVYSIR